ncbi:DUF4153 domain-containing protein [Streptococcus cristatus]|uniref:DUF4153 domain-containing protein n=1 Tax=Streptococcus cristatus TaxID=45634 RepID=UPI0011E6A7B6|nr:DUF4153 domain-containing protein [Streptococcus cristatus]
METPSQEQMTGQPYLPFEKDQERKNIFTALNIKELNNYRISSLILYFLAYFYTVAIDGNKTIYFFPIAIGLISLTEWLVRKTPKSLPQIEKDASAGLESNLFLILSLTQALALSIWGFHPQLEIFQALTLHISFSFYILSRTGWLNQGRLGIMVWYDSIQAFVILPFRNFFAGLQVFARTGKTSDATAEDGDSSKKAVQSTMIASSLLIAGMLVFFVWSQLSQVSDRFALFFSITAEVLQSIFDLIFSNLDTDAIAFRLFLALPIGLYLYSLIVGSLLNQKNIKVTYQSFQNSIQPLRMFPAFTAYIIIGSLCLTYALFFLVGLGELSELLSAGTSLQTISPQNASTVAVAGFWQLVRVSLLNFAVLAAFYLLAQKPLWDQKGTRLASTVLFIFAFLLALLAGWKLFGIYIYLYGPTPLRLISAWFILVLLVWCILTLIRFYKPIQAIRIGIFYALISFTLLCYLYPMLLAA